MATVSDLVTRAYRLLGVTSSSTNQGAYPQDILIQALNEVNRMIVENYNLPIFQNRFAFKTLPITSLSVASAIGDTSVTLLSTVGMTNTNGMMDVGGEIVTYTNVVGNVVSGIPASGNFSLQIVHNDGENVQIFTQLPDNFKYFLPNTFTSLSGGQTGSRIPEAFYSLNVNLNDGTNQYLGFYIQDSPTETYQGYYQIQAKNLLGPDTPQIPLDMDQYAILPPYMALIATANRPDSRLQNYQSMYDAALQDFLARYDKQYAINRNFNQIVSPF